MINCRCLFCIRLLLFPITSPSLFPPQIFYNKHFPAIISDVADLPFFKSMLPGSLATPLKFFLCLCGITEQNQQEYEKTASEDNYKECRS